MAQRKKKTYPNVHYGGTLEEFWERTRAFHKKHNASKETRAQAEKRVSKIVPRGMVTTAEIDAALSYLHDRKTDKSRTD